jgi:hypothetical protein
MIIGLGVKQILLLYHQNPGAKRINLYKSSWITDWLSGLRIKSEVGEVIGDFLVSNIIVQKCTHPRQIVKLYPTCRADTT